MFTNVLLDGDVLLQFAEPPVEEIQRLRPTNRFDRVKSGLCGESGQVGELIEGVLVVVDGLLVEPARHHAILPHLGDVHETRDGSIAPTLNLMIRRDRERRSLRDGSQVKEVDERSTSVLGVRATPHQVEPVVGVGQLDVAVPCAGVAQHRNEGSSLGNGHDLVVGAVDDQGWRNVRPDVRKR